MFLVSRRPHQLRINGKGMLELKGDIPYSHLDTIVASSCSSKRDNEVFVSQIYFAITWLILHRSLSESESQLCFWNESLET